MPKSDKMDKVKGFLNKKKVDAKFSKAGEGVKLSEAQQRTEARQKAAAAARKPAEKAYHSPSEANKAAASAALARLEAKNAPKPKKKPALSLQAEQMQKDPSLTRKSPSVGNARPGADQEDSQSSSAEKNDKKKFEVPLNPNDPAFLQRLAEDPIARAVYVVTAENEEPVWKGFFGLLNRYIDNVLGNPDEPKYRQIKASNRLFMEKIAPSAKHRELLEATGFVPTAESTDGAQELLYILPVSADLSVLEVVKATTQNPPHPPIDRCMKVYEPSSFPTMHWELPDCFYAHTVVDIKARHQELQSQVEMATTLRTKAMREAGQPNKKIYRFTSVRVRLPDGLLLQGYFRAHEPIKRVGAFVAGALANTEARFHLVSNPDRRQLDTEPTAMLVDLGLVPTSLVNLVWDGEPSPLQAELLAIKQPLA